MTLASFPQRAGAALFDFFTIVLLSGFISLYVLCFDINGAFFLNLKNFNQYLFSTDFFYSKIPLFISTFIFGMTICLFWTYNKGATLGQYIFNVRVVNTDETPMTFTKSFIRAFIYTLFYNIIFMHVISCLMILIRKDKLSAHDLIVGSKVVKRKD